MTTKYEELYKKALLRIPETDGRAFLAVKESVNDAQKDIARVWDVDELIVIDTTSGDTVTDQKTYHIEDDLNLTRPKDIIDITVEDGSNTRSLTWKPLKWVRKNIPYPENMSSGKPSIYTRAGNNIELIAIPDAAYDLHITHSQWPLPLSADVVETSYVDLDDVIIGLAVERTQAILSGESSTDWTARAARMLGHAHNEDRSRPDEIRVAQPFQSSPSTPISNPWVDPFSGHGRR